MSSQRPLLPDRLRRLLRERLWGAVAGSVRAKYTLTLFLVALVPLTLFVWLEAGRMREVLKEDAFHALEASARYNAALVDAFIERGLGQVASVAAVPAFGEFITASPQWRDVEREAVRSGLRGLMMNDRVFLDSVALLDRQGVNLLDTRPGQEGEGEGATLHFEQPWLTGRAAFSAREVSGGSPVLYFSAPVYLDGVPVGVLRARYSEKVLGQLLVPGLRMAGPGTFPVLANAEGRALATGLNPAAVAPGFSFANLAHGAGELSLALEHASLGGEAAREWAMAAAPLEHVDWMMAYVQPMAELMAPIHEQIRVLALTLLSMAGLLLVMGVGSVMFLIAPLNRLKHAAEAISRGRLDTQVDVRSRDEIGEVGRSFNEMARKLSRRDADLREAKRKAESANRAKSQFLAVMSHEIRTPLNSVIGFGSLLADDRRLDPALRLDVERILRASHNLLHLINDVLDYSRIEAGGLSLNCRDIYLEAVIGASLELVVGAAAKKRLELLVEVGEDVPANICCDEQRLTQVLANLLTNAVKFTDQGLVRLEVRREVSSDGAMILFAVDDTGCGVPKTARAKLFQPFSQGDSSSTRKYGGTGLGLAISRRLTEALGGSVCLVEKGSPGARFEARVPAREASAEPLSPAVSFPGSPSIWLVGGLNACRVFYTDTLKAVGVEVRVLSLEEDLPAQDADLVVMDFPSSEAGRLTVAWVERHRERLAGQRLLALHLWDFSAMAPNWPLARPELLAKPFLPCHLTGKILSLLHPNCSLPGASAPEVTGPDFSGLDARALVVDDDAMSRRLLCEILESCHIKAHPLDNASAARIWLERDQERCDVLLLDIHLPGLNGLELLKKLPYECKHNMLILVITADASQTTRQSALSRGAHAVITKPISKEKVLREIADHLLSSA